MESQLSYLSLAKHVLLLKILGLYPISPESSKTKRSFHRIHMRCVSLFLILYSCQQIIKIYKDRDDEDKMMATLFLFLTYTDYIFKVVTVWLKSDQIEEFFKITKGPIFNQGKIEHRAPLMNTVRRVLLTSRVFICMTLSTCFLWCVQPTVQHLQGIPAELPIWLPFDVNANPHFYFAVLYMWMQTSWQGLGNITIDIFIAFLFEQCKTQVSILRLDLKNIVKNSKQQAEELAISFSDALEIQLKNIVTHHSVILNLVLKTGAKKKTKQHFSLLNLRTTAKIQDIFGNAIFYQFAVGGWILCTSAYRMVKVDPASVEFLSMIFYINCILIQLFLYCYYGNEITYESDMLMESAYAADWLAFPMKHRRTLIIFMERIKIPIQPMAGFIVPLSNNTFVSILRSSYTFYAFLRNSDKG